MFIQNTKYKLKYIFFCAYMHKKQEDAGCPIRILGWAGSLDDAIIEQPCSRFSNHGAFLQRGLQLHLGASA
jgi:hypothetical protein